LKNMPIGSRVFDWDAEAASWSCPRRTGGRALRWRRLRRARTDRDARSSQFPRNREPRPRICAA
jgi:hypothetical protein